jgi:5-hydroxyisourate hydrolase
MSLSTHVLDAALGQPAAGMAVRLEAAAGGGAAGGERGWTVLVETRTDRDGRVREAFGELSPGGLAAGSIAAGTYRLVFDTGGYFAEHGVKEYFYPEVVVCFAVADPAAHYHVPLLLSPYAFSTYRGS